MDSRGLECVFKIFNETYCGGSILWSETLVLDDVAQILDPFIGLRTVDFST